MTGTGDASSEAELSQGPSADERAYIAGINSAIIEKLGPETLNEIDRATMQINAAIQMRLLNIQAQGGDPKELLSTYEKFSGALYARLHSANLDPEIAEEALKSATETMSP